MLAEVRTIVVEEKWVNCVISVGSKDLWSIVGLMLLASVYLVIAMFILQMRYLDVIQGPLYVNDAILSLQQRLIEEKISLCQNCNWSSHAAPASAACHKQQSINSYSGCISAAELSSIWSFFSVDYLSCNPGIGSTSQEKEDQSLYFHSLPPMLYSITEAAMDPMASDVDKFSGKKYLNSLSEKV